MLQGELTCTGGERQRACVASPLQRDGGRTLCDAKCDVEFVLLADMHACEVHAHEVYAHEVHAYEVHAREAHAHEVYAP